MSISDLLLIVLIADAAQNAMANEYRSISEGCVLIATIAFWDYFLDWVGYRVPAINRLLHAPPLLLIKGGQLQNQHMKQQMITEDELISQLREQGVASVSEVQVSYLESDGHISVIRQEPGSQPKRRSEKP